MKRVQVFNPHNYVVSIGEDGRMVAGGQRADVDPTDPVAALAIEKNLVVLVSKDVVVSAEPAPIPEDAPVAVEEAPAEPTTSTKKKNSTTTSTTTESKEN